MSMNKYVVKIHINVFLLYIFAMVYVLGKLNNVGKNIGKVGT